MKKIEYRKGLRLNVGDIIHEEINSTKIYSYRIIKILKDINIITLMRLKDFNKHEFNIHINILSDTTNKIYIERTILNRINKLLKL